MERERERERERARSIKGGNCKGRAERKGMGRERDLTRKHFQHRAGLCFYVTSFSWLRARVKRKLQVFNTGLETILL